MTTMQPRIITVCANCEDDTVRVAVTCADCDPPVYLCASCDEGLHFPRKMKHHKRYPCIEGTIRARTVLSARGRGRIYVHCGHEEFVYSRRCR